MNEINSSSRVRPRPGPPPDLNLFRVFDAIFRERNLTRAARTLGLGQPAVSHALNRLRQHLDDPLFERSGRGVAPTQRAAQLAPAIAEALALLDGAAGAGDDFDPSRDLRTVRIALPQEMDPFLLPGLFARIHAIAPQALVVSVRLNRATLRADLAARRADLAFDIAQPADPDIRQLPLYRDRFVVMGGAAWRGRPLTADAYRAAAHVTVSSRPSGPAVEDFLLSQHGLDRRVVLRCQHYETARRVVAESDLLLTVPALISGPPGALTPPTDAADSGDLVILPMPVDLPPLAVNLYWHRRSDGEADGLWLRNALTGLFTPR